MGAVDKITQNIETISDIQDSVTQMQMPMRKVHAALQLAIVEIPTSTVNVQDVNIVHNTPFGKLP